MQSDQDKDKTKQAYQKPRLRAIELAAEEVLSVGCKMAEGPFGSGGNPDCGIGNSCVGDGS